MKTLILAAVLVGLVAVAKDPKAGIKSDNKSNAQGSEANRQHDTAATSTATATTTPQPVPNREASGVDPKAPHHDTHPPNSGPPQKPWFDSQFWFNLLLVIFTGLLAALAYRQLRAMHRQADLMSGQLASMTTTGDDTHVLAVAAQTAAAAAKQQSEWAEHTVSAMLRQESLMATQADAMIGQLRAALLSIKTAEEGVATTRSQLEAYDRPWITATIAVGSGVFLLDDGRIGIAVTPVLANVGKSVAVDVDYRLEFTRLIEPEDIDALPSRIAVLQRRKPSGSGFSIFPGEHVEKMLEGYDLPAVPTEVQPVMLQWNSPFVCIGAVFYSFANSKTEHVTGFACLLRIVNSGDRIKENLAAGVGSVHLTPEHVEVMPQRHLTRAN
jgi:hypothetical protein